MSESLIKLRVYKIEKVDEKEGQRGETIILWNTDVLSPELKQQPNIQIKFVGSSGWFSPPLAVPDLKAIKQSAIDGPTDGRSILHQGNLNENSSFTFHISFGPNQSFSTDLDVLPRGAHVGHVRAMRLRKGQRHNILDMGKPVYAYPAIVVAYDDAAINQITQAMIAVVQRYMGR